MSFLLKSALVIALVYFLLHKDEFIAAPKPPPNFGRSAARGEHASAGAGEDVMTALQRAAAAKLVGAARERCLASPRDCLSMLKAIGAKSSKHGADMH